MANLEVGNLFFNITANCNQAIKSVDSISKSLSKLNTSLNNISSTINNFNGGFVKLSVGFDTLEKSLTPLLSKINVYKNSINTFNRFLNFKSLDNLDFRKVYNNFNSLNRIIDPFLQKIEKSAPALIALSNAINKLDKTTKAVNRQNGYGTSNEKLKKNASGFFNLGKLYFFLNYTKRLSQALSKMITSAIDFNETLNKFQVSMGEYYGKSIKFVNSLTYAFNLSTESIMNYQSTFKNMLDAIGNLDRGTTYQLSETLTRMAIDYASLFNVSIDKAMQQFQSVLSGQIKFSLASKELLEK